MEKIDKVEKYNRMNRKKKAMWEKKNYSKW